MGKFVSAQEAAKLVNDGMTVMIGGFMNCGTPEAIIDAIVERGIGNLTVVSNDSGYENIGIGKLIAAGLVKKLITSHIGLNPQTGRLMTESAIEVILTPQGTLAEQIRAAGAGLGGVLTPTGLGTSVQDGKQTVIVDGKEYLLEKPIRADVSLILGSSVDKEGNVFYKGTTRNFNPLMAMASEVVIVQAENLVEPGNIEPENVATPGIFVDYIVA